MTNVVRHINRLIDIQETAEISLGPASAGRVPSLNGLGVLDASLLPTTAGLQNYIVNIQYGISYSPTVADRNSIILMTAASANTVVLDYDFYSGFTDGDVLEVASFGSGSTTIVAGPGITLLYPTGPVLRSQYSRATLYHTSSNTWTCVEDTKI